jgi:hypothetical protein
MCLMALLLLPLDVTVYLWGFLVIARYFRCKTTSQKGANAKVDEAAVMKYRQKSNQAGKNHRQKCNQGVKTHDQWRRDDQMWSESAERWRICEKDFH